MLEYWDQIFVGALVILVFVAFVKEWGGPDLVAMSAFVLVMLMGIVDVDKAMKEVFTNSAPIVIACMFILSASLERTGLIEAMGNWFEKIAGKEEVRILLVMMLVVAPLSAFINNTPVVVVFMPIVLGLARKYDLVASRFLIPLSYAAIAGGTCTIVGTSTNLIAAVPRAGDFMATTVSKEWAKRDPIPGLAARMIAAGQASQADFDQIEQEIMAEVAAAVDFAENSPWPEVQDSTQYMFV